MNRTDRPLLGACGYIWAALLVGLAYFAALDPGDAPGVLGFAALAVIHGGATTAALATGGFRSPAYRLHVYLPALGLGVTAVLVAARLPLALTCLTASIPGLIVGNGLAWCQVRRREREAGVDAREAGRAAPKLFRWEGDPTLN